MSDERDDEISQWAAALEPDGGPGTWSVEMRKFLGDRRFEETQEKIDHDIKLHMQRKELVNNLLGLVLVYGSVLGFVAIVASVAVLAKYIF